MQKYLLFIDTETSGLPKNWKLPYSADDNWPHAVQISWVIYTNNREEVKREDHYIRDNDFVISPQAFKIHGISRDFLNENGVSRNAVLEKLYDDLNFYMPLVVGHFVELDYNVTGVDFYREGMANPMVNLPTYCTMIGSKQFVRNPQVTFLKLGQLYQYLFNDTLKIQHNAIYDALATAACFFEMEKRGDINDLKIADQQAERQKANKMISKSGCGVPVILFFIITLIIAYWI